MWLSDGGMGGILKLNGEKMIDMTDWSMLHLITRLRRPTSENYRHDTHLLHCLWQSPLSQTEWTSPIYCRILRTPASTRDKSSPSSDAWFRTYPVSRFWLESIETVAGKIVLGMNHELHWISRRNRHRGWDWGGFFIQFEIVLNMFRLEEWQDLSSAFTHQSNVG